MSTSSIERIKNLAAVAEELIIAGYSIYTIYADQNEMHVDVSAGMPDPCEIKSTKQNGRYVEHKGTIGGVSITWLVANKQEVAA